MNEPDPQLITATKVLLTDITDYERILVLNQVLLSVEFKGTIHQIRELVNDPKWDDKE